MLETEFVLSANVTTSYMLGPNAVSRDSITVNASRAPTIVQFGRQIGL
jgi:hypothetical protein